MLILKKKKYIIRKKIYFFAKFGLYYMRCYSKRFKKHRVALQKAFLKRFKLIESVKNISFFYNLSIKKKYFSKKTFLIKIVATNRNLIVGVFCLKNRLQFLLSMGSIDNSNLKRKSLYACNILLKSLLSRKLYNKYLLKLKYKFIFMFLGSGKFYKFAYKSLMKNKVKPQLIIQKNNFPHNGCFKKKKRRR